MFVPTICQRQFAVVEQFAASLIGGRLARLGKPVIYLENEQQDEITFDVARELGEQINLSLAGPDAGARAHKNRLTRKPTTV